MKAIKLLAAGVAVIGSALVASAQTVLLTDFESFTTPTANGTVLFRQPSFSGTTSSKIEGAPSPNISQVLSTGIPSGNPNVGNNALLVSWNFVDTATPFWLRLTTFNATSLPNPTVSLLPNWGIQFDIHTDTPIYVAALIRETESNAALGANGGATGTIEFVGGNPSAASGNRGIPIPANTWTTVTINFSTAPVFGFTGNGVLDPGTDNKGVLEALGIATDAINTGDIRLWLDNFYILEIPEPSSLALSLLGGLGAAIWMIRRRMA
jgi:hypothetical protein